MKVYLIIFFLGIAVVAKTQSIYKLIGEVNSRSVTLIWTVSEWEQDLDCVILKKRTISANGKFSQWETLTSDPLKQYNSLEKSLNNVTNSYNKLEYLVNRRIILFSNTEALSTKISAFSNEEFAQKLMSNSESIKMLGLLFTFDYDIALLYGFGYIDSEIQKKGDLEYGLFPIYKGLEEKEPSAIFKCNVNQDPNLDISIVNQKIKRRGKTLQLKMEFDGNEMDSKETLAGFNIYKQVDAGIKTKVNNQVIWLSKDTNQRLLVYEDKIESKESKYSYFVVPVSIFKNEGKEHKIQWALNDEITIKPPILYTEQHKNSDYFIDGVNLKWSFNLIQEDEILGYVIQRRLGDDQNFEIISDTIAVSNRIFVDNTLTDKSIKNYYYRVVVLPKDSYPLWSNTEHIYYNPKPIIKGVIALTSDVNAEAFQSTVNLYWNVQEDFLNQISGFVLYCDRSGGILARETDYSDIKSNNINYIVEGGVGRRYGFNLKYENLDGAINNYSDTIEVVIPNVELPTAIVWPFRALENALELDWKYSTDIIDLKGFRIYINNQLVEDENEVDANQRSWKSQYLDPGVYEVQVVAVSDYGVLSARSQKRKIKLE